MYVFCFGLDTECHFWQGLFDEAGVELVSVNLYELENRNKMAEVLKMIEDQVMKAKDPSLQTGTGLNQAPVLVLYRHMTMDANVEEYFRSLPSKAMRLPIGAEAIMLDRGNANPVFAEQLNQYLLYSGEENTLNAGRYILKNLMHIAGIDQIDAPIPTPFDGIFSFVTDRVYTSLDEYFQDVGKSFPHYVGIITHRQAWLRGSMPALRLLVEKLESFGVGAVLVFTYAGLNSLSFREVSKVYFSIGDELQIDALINLQLFAIRAEEGNSVAEQSVIEYERLGIPVLSPVQSNYIDFDQWLMSMTPLSADLPSALIIPEMAGSIEPVIISTMNSSNGQSEAIVERVGFLAKRLVSLIDLQAKQNHEKRIAVILHNSVCSGVEATIGKAFGLDSFESITRLFSRLESEGYQLGDYPQNGKELFDLFMEKKAFSDFRWTAVEDIVNSGGCLYQMPVAGEYEGYFNELPVELQETMVKTWGDAPGEGMVLGDKLVITGINFGNVTVMVQPKRGCYGAKCTGEVCKILHDPACPPPHQYLATYRYIEHVFKADALVDMGTDGSVEYLPGKANGLSALCWPNVIIGSLPSIYAYNAGVTNEGLIAKRRMNSVIVDYLPPASSGVDEQSRLLLRRIEEYFQSLALANDQDQEAEQEIRKLIDENPAAMRILGQNDDFNQSLMEISNAIKNTESAMNISKPHIFGEIPSAEEMENYLREVHYGDGDDEAFDMDSLDSTLIKANLAQTDNEMLMMLQALQGAYIPPGESGMPDNNGRNILPTGRNMFGLNIDRVPTKTAYQRGISLADQLIECYIADEGRLPEQVAMNMISLDVTRSNGEQLSQFLYLIGVRPVWDREDRVIGLEVIGLDELARPRIDVTVRISGVLRDTWPTAVEIMDKAVMMVSVLDESEADNYLLKHLHEFNASIEPQEDDDRQGNIRIFGDPPGTYGAGLDLALLASAWKDESDLVKYFINASAYAYGINLNGKKSLNEFIEVVKKVDLSTDTTSSRRTNALSESFSTQVQGGFRLMAKHLSDKLIRQYQSTSDLGREIITESLGTNLKRHAEESLFNEFWKESMMDKAYDGASDIMHLIQSVFSAQCLTDCFSDDFLDRLAEDYVNDEEMRNWFTDNNPFALEEIARRMLELYTREKWLPDEDVLDRLKDNYLIIEGDMEGRTESAGDIQAGNVDILNDQDVQSWRELLQEVEKALDISKK
ncbi:MAG: cobaltochelatase subunit CobN [Coriobacteriia bacterium]|nr:cobaltochelatase subunit CobN [Coriobacteriia bacterium]